MKSCAGEIQCQGRLGYWPCKWIDLLPNADVVSSYGNVGDVDDVLSTELDSEQ